MLAFSPLSSRPLSALPETIEFILPVSPCTKGIDLDISRESIDLVGSLTGADLGLSMTGITLLGSTTGVILAESAEELDLIISQRGIGGLCRH